MRRSLVSCLLTIVLVGCGSSESEPAADVDSTVQLAPAPDGPPAAWSYDGDTGPEHWADLDTAYAACDGDRQSPIALDDTTARSSQGFNANYIMELGSVVDAGHTIRVTTSGGMLMHDGRIYGLRQFHVHTPAEHTLNGTRYPAEVHLVHRAQDGTLAILGVFVEEGSTTNPALKTWITGADTTMTFRPTQFFPQKQNYYTYEGSLTTPPCSEPVRWMVMDRPISASAAQLDTLRAHQPDNARPLQPRDDRPLTYVTP